MHNLNQSNKEFAGFFVRFAAYIIDMFIVGVALMILRLPVWIMQTVIPDFFLTKAIIFEFSVWDIVLYLLGIAYFVLLTYITGATLGKKLLRIEVISVETEKLSFWNVLYRESIGRYLSTVIINIGYILVGLDPQKRGLHDILCDTRVVYKGMFSETKEVEKFSI